MYNSDTLSREKLDFSGVLRYADGNKGWRFYGNSRNLNNDGLDECADLRTKGAHR